ncbi:terminus macrodomain insulation protein YfbV [Alteromonas sp. CYL-A6]|uniref:terminus macrodomain insulation protein YfbV n=1 Tax=Alteromonas nitratireducens TaxID=3390813 RepID=UPI0034A9C263
MAQSLMTLLHDGQQYMKTWPMKKELYPLFPECRVVGGTRFALKVMPPAAVLVCAVLFQLQGSAHLPQTLAIGLFFMSLPVQGLLWLGHRANQQLPPALRQWYRQIHDRMRQQGCNVHVPPSRPRYIELARLLKNAFDDLDSAFTRNWFG